MDFESIQLFSTSSVFKVYYAKTNVDVYKHCSSVFFNINTCHHYREDFVYAYHWALQILSMYSVPYISGDSKDRIRRNRAHLPWAFSPRQDLAKKAFHNNAQAPCNTIPQERRSVRKTANKMQL